MHVSIDDYIPCFCMGNPIFARNINPYEIWVLILEKAYAKCKGNYFCLRGGFIH